VYVTKRWKGRRENNDNRCERDRLREDDDLSNADGTKTFPRRRCDTREQTHLGNYFTDNLEPAATP